MLLFSVLTTSQQFKSAKFFQFCKNFLDMAIASLKNKGQLYIFYNQLVQKNIDKVVARTASRVFSSFYLFSIAWLLQNRKNALFRPGLKFRLNLIFIHFNQSEIYLELIQTPAKKRKKYLYNNNNIDLMTGHLWSTIPLNLKIQ